MKLVRAWQATVTAAVGVVLMPAIASATPSSGVQSELLGTIDVPVSLPSAPAGGTDVTFRRIEIAPGGYTGWHWHEGPVYALVAGGTLTRVLADCTEVVSPTGAVVEEVVGRSQRHNGVNQGDVPTVLFVAYLMPSGQPLSVDAEASDCT
ncbi:cupin domain-containing protein [Hoyosella subflava]|uniref:Cupin 2 conserved barrel domain-containing protein n=1 Tax=Hoyosella subflava (strain DSM 45089 / JCM 17490 / NBRC 109087 / DQS3-9A1) TaxID=443218 RepID=F6ENE9_HOYSD|nr:cupin domain-containing protein [Hoyosella subflava]AEF40420.1 hypothetical protein AS9A_1971 [Hoyosella subflava DQS3-9A1]